MKFIRSSIITNFLNKKPLTKLWLVPKIIWSSWLSFANNHGLIRACAITYATLLAIVPFFILLGFIAGKLGYWKLVVDYIPFIIQTTHINLPINETKEFIVSITQTNTGSLGLFGAITLTFSFISAMSNLEVNMNVMWRIKKNRNYIHKIGVYSPFLLYLILITTILGSLLVEFKAITNTVLNSLNFNHNALVNFLELNYITAYTIGFIWLFIFSLYWFIPYTKVKVIPALIGSFVTLNMLAITALISVNLQTMMFKRLAVIYGSLSVIPFLMIVIYIFWIIILVGNALTFHIQYRKMQPSYMRRKSDSKHNLDNTEIDSN